MNADKNGMFLSIGDRVNWDFGRYRGTIVELAGPGNEIIRQGLSSLPNTLIKLDWDVGGGGWVDYRHMTLVKVEESHVISFFEEIRRQGRSHFGRSRGTCVGRDFCDRFNITDSKLFDEKCPGKSVRRIIDVFAGARSSGLR